MIAGSVAPAGDPVAAPAVDVAEALEQAPFRRLPLLACGLCFLSMLADGFDLQAMAFAAPTLLGESRLQRAELGPVLAAALVGNAIGAAVLGALGDRRGRRLALALSLLLVALMSLGTVLARDAGEFILWRLLTGIGMGGVIPNSMALTHEFAPARLRASLVAATIVGVPLGGMLGAAVSAWVLALAGWRGIFVAAAILPAVLAVVVWRWLPESPRYLAGHVARHADLAALLNRIWRSPRYSGHTRFLVGETLGQGHAGHWRALLGRELRRDTLLVWFVFVANLCAIYALLSWLPTVLVAAGLSMKEALRGSLLFNLGGVLVTALTVTVASGFGSRRMLLWLGAAAASALLALAATTATGATSGRVAWLSLLIVAAGGGMLGAQNNLYGFVAGLYPTRLRATGLGWAAGVGRIGGILGSLYGGSLPELAAGPGIFFLAVALGVGCAMLGIQRLGAA
jgi:AAHS family 4-hydroxybenzoate transporter-like MFS transporter